MKPYNLGGMVEPPPKLHHMLIFSYLANILFSAHTYLIYVQTAECKAFAIASHRHALRE